MANFQIYTTWPAIPTALQAKHPVTASWLQAMMVQGTSRFFDNIDTEVHALSQGEFLFPITLTRGIQSPQNAYVCSPTAHYIDYTLAEMDIEMQEHPRLKRALYPMVFGLGEVLKSLRFEKVVYVNNWLLSTNLYPDFDLSQLEGLTDYLAAQYPDSAIVFRSVNQTLNTPLFQALQQADYLPILSRQVYYLDPRSGEHRKKRSLKEDRRLVNKSAYQWLTGEEITAQMIPRLRWLYDDLYLRKYSYINPQFNETFIRESLDKRWLTFYALHHNGRIDGVIGYFERNGIFTTPFFGYDTRLPQSLGLYRLLTYKLIEEAEQRQWLFNCSSGVASFKKTRGCEASLEYMMVYAQHLPRIRQVPWTLLERACRHVAEPVIQRLGL
jgi:hypothetical protein